MARSNKEWRVEPHAPIQKLAENLWRVSGSLPHVTLRRTMTLVRLGDGPADGASAASPALGPRVLVHSAIALDEPAMRQIEAWGTPAFLVVPNGLHRLDAAAYKARYPAMRVFAPKGARAKVEEVVPVDATLDMFPHDPHVRFETLAGIGESEAAMIVRSQDGVSIVFGGDVVFNMDRKRDPIGFFVTTLCGSAPGPRVSRLYKRLHVTDKAALRSDLERLAMTEDLVRLVVAHENVATGPDAAAALRKAATYL